MASEDFTRVSGSLCFRPSGEVRAAELAAAC